LLTSKTAKTVSKVPIQHGEQTNKMAKEFEIGISFYQFHPGPFMSLN